eukprot:scaffold82731_cov68-Phaeocystis_antarctica.AAC.1
MCHVPCASEGVRRASGGCLTMRRRRARAVLPTRRPPSRRATGCARRRWTHRVAGWVHRVAARGVAPPAVRAGGGVTIAAAAIGAGARHDRSA